MAFPSVALKPHSPAFLALITTTCSILPMHLLAQEIVETSHKFSVGTYLSQGKYGANDNTDIIYFPASYELSHFPWVLSVTVPYLSIKGPGDVFLETGNIGRGRGSVPEYIDEAGLGDIFVSASYQLPALTDSGLFMDLSLQAKLPTADETRDLGTGETDYGPQVDVYLARGRNTWFANAGYRWRGKTALYDLRDSAYGSIGMMRQFGENTYLGLVYDYREKASTSSYDSHELMPFVSWNISKRWNLMVYTITGFTDSSADQTLGAQVSFTIP